MPEPSKTIYGEGYCEKHDITYRNIQGLLGGCYLCKSEKIGRKLPPEPTEEEIRRVLSEKVMGGEKIGHFYHSKERITGSKFCFIPVEYWRPDENIEQAMMCAEQITRNTEWGMFEATIEQGRYFATFYAGGREIMYEGRTTTEAIARACYEAVKEE